MDTASIFALRGMTLYSCQCRIIGPNFGCVQIQFWNRSELLEKAQKATIKNIVVGSPGTTTPIKPITTFVQPKAMSAQRAQQLVYLVEVSQDLLSIKVTCCNFTNRCWNLNTHPCIHIDYTNIEIPGSTFSGSTCMNDHENFTLPFGTRINSDGIWSQVLNRCQGTGTRPALFLDRDGVVVEEVNYLHRVKDVALVPGAADVILRANAQAVPVIIVTNQAGIGYGKYGWREFSDVQQQIIQDLVEYGAFINAVFACPFHVKGKPPFHHPDHPGRKPNPGMLIEASNMLAIDLSQSWIVGDRASDLGAGKNAGLAGGMHVKTGHGGDMQEQSKSQNLKNRAFKTILAESIFDALKSIPILGSA
jgi:D-glycero-D-manno-heptose 1,7-bisphosphate phosphatase